MSRLNSFLTNAGLVAANLRERSRLMLVLGCSAFFFSQVGCTAFTSPLAGIPAKRLPPQFLATPKNNLIPIDISRLGQEPSRQYLLDGGDILGVYIEGVLPFNLPDQPPQLPPVNFPDKDSTLPPSVGYPIAIQDEGTIALPLIRPLNVRGLTVEQVRELIRREYVSSGILKEDSNRYQTPIVTLLKQRTYNVVVIRQDMNPQRDTVTRSSYTRGADQSATGNLIKLPAGQNDILHALMATGGLPGLNAKNEVKVLRSSDARNRRYDELLREYFAAFYCNPDPCLCPPPLPDDPAVLKIPLRVPPGVFPNINPESVILGEGDIVYIESRDAEVFYTGGLLPGGEWPLPRDYDLDVLGAIAISGAAVSSPQRGMGGGLAQGLASVPPGMVYILRKTPCNGQITIEVDLAKALNDPRQRPLIQPGDMIILRFKPIEEVLNFSIASFFTFGIRQLLR